MPREIRTLSPAEVNRLREKPGLHGVGPTGVYLRVTRRKDAEGWVYRRSWILRATVGSKRRDIGLGSYPAVGLARARVAAEDARDLIRQGVDPVEEKKRRRAQLEAEQAARLTFRDAAEAVLRVVEGNSRSAKHAAQWRMTLTRYAYPVLGSMACADIDTPHVLRVLWPLWEGGKAETGKRVRQRIHRVLDYATSEGARDGLNPARWKGHLDHRLPRPGRVKRRRHFASLPYQRVPDFMAALRERRGVTARALEFAILTGARSEAVRGATWREVDLESATWTIRETATRGGVKATGDDPQPVRLALSSDAIALLRTLPQGEPSARVFLKEDGARISENGLTKPIEALHRAELAAGREGWVDPVDQRRVTVHGFRSSFIGWNAEVGRFPDVLAQLALGHQLGDDTTQSYDRTDRLDPRRPLMEGWAAWCRGDHATP